MQERGATRLLEGSCATSPFTAFEFSTGAAMLYLHFMEGRPVRDSVSELSEFALPMCANPLGNLLGGPVIRLVGIWLPPRPPCVTRGARWRQRLMDSFLFLNPIHIGQLVTLRASVNRVFRTFDGGQHEGHGGGPADGGDPPYQLVVPDLCRADGRGHAEAGAAGDSGNNEEKRRYDAAGLRRVAAGVARSGARSRKMPIERCESS